MMPDTPRAVAVAAALLSLAATAEAKPPSWTFAMPTGVQRGQTATLEVGGSFDHWPPQVVIEGAGVTIEPSADAEKKQLVVTAAADAPLGPCWVRLVDEEGATAVRPLLVGTLPDVAEVEPNNRADEAQAIDSGAAVSGVLARGEVDSFAVTAARGQTIVASLLGNRWLGAPMDAVLQICTPQGFVLRQDDDERGLDPQLAFVAPRDGTYVVRVFAFPAAPNSSIAFAGGDDYRYRLTITSGPFIDYGLPLTWQAGAEATPVVRLYGWNLDAPYWEQVDAQPLESGPLGVGQLWLGDPRAAGGLAACRRDLPAVLGSDTLDSPPASIPLDCVVSGRLHDAPVHSYRLTGSKGQALTIDAESAALGFALDPVVSVHDAEGKLLKEADDIARGNADAKLDFSFPADGDFEVRIRDAHDRTGSRLVYRLTLQSAPAFTLSLAAGEFAIPADKPLEIEVTVGRLRGFGEPIKVEAVDLPEGVTAEPVVSEPKGDTAKAVKLTLKSNGNHEQGPITIQGSAGDQLISAEYPLPNTPLRLRRPWLR